MPDDVVLVVEDDPVLLDMIILTLEGRFPVRVAVARDGLQALRQAKQSRPCLVLLDLAIPGLDGIQVAKLMKAQPAAGHTPLVALTGGDEAVRDALGAGCVTYIAKPFCRETLTQVVSRHLPNVLERDYVVEWRVGGLRELAAGAGVAVANQWPS